MLLFKHFHIFYLSLFTVFIIIKLLISPMMNVALLDNVASVLKINVMLNFVPIASSDEIKTEILAETDNFLKLCVRKF